MTEPPEKDSPRKRSNAYEGKQRSFVASTAGDSYGMFPAVVNAARCAWRAWPTWLGSRWLKDRRRAAP